MESIINRFNKHTVWLFAFGAVALGVAAAYATAGMGPEVTSGVYAAIVGIAGFASMLTTRARVRGAVLAFLVAAIAAAGLYYLVVSTIMQDVTTAAADAVSGGAAHEQGKEAGTAFGRIFGAFAAAIAFLETWIVGIAGAVVGSKAKTMAQNGQLIPRAARA